MSHTLVPSGPASVIPFPRRSRRHVPYRRRPWVEDLECRALLTGSTGTGLDKLVTIIQTDRGLKRNLPAAQVAAGAQAADQLDRLIVDAIRSTGVANDKKINQADVREISLFLNTNSADTWARLHGDDDGNTGFHIVQGNGANSRLYKRNAVDTVAEGIYDLGFEIDGDNLTDENGDGNVSVAQVTSWLSDLLKSDLAAGRLANPNVQAYARPTSGTGLDRLVTLIANDPGLNRNLPTSQITAGAMFADQMDRLIVEAIRNTGVANNRTLNQADVREINRYLQANRADLWAQLHGDDEGDEESGFHLVRDDGGTTRLYGQNAIDTVLDGLYHIGFAIDDDNFLNEDGDDNASVESVTAWLNDLLKNDLAGGVTLTNTNVQAYARPTTGTGLDRIVTLIAADQGLNRELPTSQITAGAMAADAMNRIIIEGIRALGLANDGTINTADVRDLNTYIRDHDLDLWTTLHGDDAGGIETGFHLVQDDGAVTRLYRKNAVDTVADGIYHMGFLIDCDTFLNEDGDRNAEVEDVAAWVNDLLKSDLAAGRLANPNVQAYARGTTGTGLDQLVTIIAADKGLNREIATSQITAGARAADAMNAYIITAIRQTGVGRDGTISEDDLRAINAYVQTHWAAQWAQLHGDDEGGIESGFHLVRGDGGTSRLYGEDAVDTVADGIYHIGFDIVDDRFLNEDGDANACLSDVAGWLNNLLAADLAARRL